MPSARSRVTVNVCEALRRHAGPERDLRAFVEGPDRDEHARLVAQPGLVETTVVEARQSGGLELDLPAGRCLGERRLACGARREVGRSEGRAEAPTGRAGAENGGQPDRDGEHGSHRETASRRGGVEPMPGAGVAGPRSARAGPQARRRPRTELRVSATARCCSASRSASSADAATRASSAARFSSGSDPSASAASSAVSSPSRRRLIDTAIRTVTPETSARRPQRERSHPARPRSGRRYSRGMDVRRRCLSEHERQLLGKDTP